MKILDFGLVKLTRGEGAEGLAEELAGDAEAVRELLRFDEPAVAFDLMRRWRSGHREALLVVDQRAADPARSSPRRVRTASSWGACPRLEDMPMW